MDYHDVWCGPKDGVRDTEFADAAHAYLTHLKAEGLISGYKITHCKFGLGPAHFPEFDLVIETEGLAQLDEAFRHISSSTDPVELFHHAVNSLVKDPFFAL